MSLPRRRKIYRASLLMKSGQWVYITAEEVRVEKGAGTLHRISWEGLASHSRPSFIDVDEVAAVYFEPAGHRWRRG